MSNHMPAWWVDDEGCVAEGRGDDYNTITDALNPNDAFRIVRAVNSHDDLVTWLENCIECLELIERGHFDAAEDWTDANIEHARAALALAEGETT